MKWEVTSNYESKLVRYYDNRYGEGTRTAQINSDDNALMDARYKNVRCRCLIGRSQHRGVPISVGSVVYMLLIL